MGRPKIIYVTGGQRSGKSLYAERKALSLSDFPVYIATSQVRDEEMRRRVEAHRLRRGPQWTTLEEPLHVGSLPLGEGQVAVFDCVTLWASNWFFHCGEDVIQALEAMKKQLDGLCGRGATIIFVSNEIGLGGISENVMQRRFTDLQGMINQHIASLSDEAHLIVSGIDVRIKG